MDLKCHILETENSFDIACSSGELCENDRAELKKYEQFRKDRHIKIKALEVIVRKRQDQRFILAACSLGAVKMPDGFAILHKDNKKGPTWLGVSHDGYEYWTFTPGGSRWDVYQWAKKRYFKEMERYV